MMVCEPLVRSGVNRGKAGTGTKAGYNRHMKAGEPACDACAAAERERMRAWRTANADHVREYNRRYEAAHPEMASESFRRYRERHPDRRREQVMAWQRRNPDKTRQYRRRYWASDRGRRVRAINEAKRKARRLRATVVEFSVDQLEARLSMFPGCWMCGEEADTVDHVKPLSKGGLHVLSNLRPACRSCNASKKDTWPLSEVA